MREKNRLIKEFIKNKVIIISVILLLILLWILPIKDNISMCIEYSNEYDNNFSAQIFWKHAGEFNEKESSVQKVDRNCVDLEIKEDLKNITDLRIDPADKSDQFAITSLQIKNHGVCIKTIPIRELVSIADFEYLQMPTVVLGVLYLRPTNSDPQIVLNYNFIEQYIIKYIWRYKIIVSVYLIMLSIIGITIQKNINYLRNCLSILYKHYNKIIRIVLIIALGLVAYMAFRSFDYVHPDENMSKAAIEYYVKYSKPADFRDKNVIDSFSSYGHSRLSELSVYYFLAGKIAYFVKNLFGVVKYYRAFNVLLFAIMVGIFLKKGKEYFWLYVLLGMTPQVWYIFSYATSDAWDYFLSFLIIYQLMMPSSLFNQMLLKKDIKKAVFGLMFIGSLFGILILGKKNYYFIFVTSFIFLTWRLFKEKRNALQMVLRYSIVVITCLLLYTCISKYDMYRYEDKKAVSSEYGNKYASEIKESDIQSVAITDGAGIKMRDQGFSLKEIAIDRGFFSESYKSYMGKYGWMQYDTNTFYYIMMGILYFIVFLIIGWTIFQENTMIDKCLFWALMILNFIILIVSLWHSWTSDFQAQGRYLFPMNFNIAICVYLCQFKDRKKETIFKMSVCTISCLSIYSYLFYGIAQLT